MNSLLKLDNLPLHDAVLHSITLHWKEGKVELSMAVFIEAGRPAIDYKLIFLGVVESNCPHMSPWGDSTYINSAEEVSGIYSIEMQSGDVLSFKGKGFEFIEAAL